jgi:hypothetical protein
METDMAKRFVAALLPLVLGLSLLTASPVFAAGQVKAEQQVNQHSGSPVVPHLFNGQPIAFHDTRGDVYEVCVHGRNQNGRTVDNCWQTPGYVTKFQGWYWVGQVELNEYDINTFYLRAQYTTVPQVQGQVWWCFYDGGNGYAYGCSGN